MRAFNQPRNIRHHKAALFFRFPDRNDTEIRLQRGKWIISDLWTRRRDTRNQRGLTDVGIADEAHISKQLEFQAEDAFLAGSSLFVLTRSLVWEISKARVASPAAPAAGNYDAFICARKIVDLLSSVCVVHDRAH